MEYENLIIEIEGEAVKDISQDILHLKVELDEKLTSTLGLRIATSLKPDGIWKYLDNERFRPWKHVSIRRTGRGNVPDEVMSGYITQIKPYFAAEPRRFTLEIVGMDGSVLLDRKKKSKESTGIDIFFHLY